MDNKRLGLVILSIGIIIAGILIILIGRYNQAIIDEGCFPTENCKRIESSLSVSHIAFGIVGFILSLGVYMLIFSNGEEAILTRLEEEKQMKIDEGKFDILLKALDPFEQKVLKAIKGQNGITQNTLRLRTDLSKAKVSYVVNDLEDKGLIKRVKNNKTYSIYLKENI